MGPAPLLRRLQFETMALIGNLLLRRIPSTRHVSPGPRCDSPIQISAVRILNSVRLLSDDTISQSQRLVGEHVVLLHISKLWAEIWLLLCAYDARRSTMNTTWEVPAYALHTFYNRIRFDEPINYRCLLGAAATAHNVEIGSALSQLEQ